MTLLTAFAMPVGLSVRIEVARVTRAMPMTILMSLIVLFASAVAFLKRSQLFKRKSPIVLNLVADWAGRFNRNMAAVVPPFAATTFLVALYAGILTATNDPTTKPPASEKPAVDQLIPWLLDEESQLRGIPFSEVIADATGKRVLPFDPKDETDQRVVKQISVALNETLKRSNAAGSPVQNVKRINEVSSHFEDSLREFLNAAPGLKCDFPRTADGKVQRSGYPDLRIVDVATNKVFYLDPKLYALGSRESSFRTFYFEPKVATGKIHDDAVHFIAGIEHQPSVAAATYGSAGQLSQGYVSAGQPSPNASPARTSGSASEPRESGSASPKTIWQFTRWDVVDLSNFKVKLKAEFQGSNRDMYRPEAVVASSAKGSDK